MFYPVVIMAEWQHIKYLIAIHKYLMLSFNNIHSLKILFIILKFKDHLDTIEIFVVMFEEYFTLLILNSIIGLLNFYITFTFSIILFQLLQIYNNI